jgi:hypothetical protein
VRTDSVFDNCCTREISATLTGTFSIARKILETTHCVSDVTMEEVVVNGTDISVFWTTAPK